MNISAIKTGDIVECDFGGRRFHAIVTNTGGAPSQTPADRAGLTIQPFHKAITYRHATARQVVGHWRKAGRPRTKAA